MKKNLPHYHRYKNLKMLESQMQRYTKVAIHHDQFRPFSFF